MRREKTITIPDEGRDKGKKFVITEMPADQGERWANRFVIALANADADIPDEVFGNGMAGLAAVGVAGMLIQALKKIRFDQVEPLLTEMMACVQYQHAPSQPPQSIVPGPNCQIEEITTFWTLRLAWIELHTNFSLAAARQVMAQPTAQAA